MLSERVSAMKQVFARQRRHSTRPVSEKTGGRARRLTVKHYYTADGLGSVRTLTDSSGVLKTAYDYASCGEPYAPGTSVAVSQRYTYTGREKSAVGGPMYYRWRFYEASTGLFLAYDPAGYANNPSGKLYEYALNDPTNCGDPFGLGSKTVLDWKDKKLDLDLYIIRFTLTINEKIWGKWETGVPEEECPTQWPSDPQLDWGAEREGLGANLHIGVTGHGIDIKFGGTL
jgi:RHS repeat-associated protein